MDNKIVTNKIDRLEEMIKAAKDVIQYQGEDVDKMDIGEWRYFIEGYAEDNGMYWSTDEIKAFCLFVTAKNQLDKLL